jgi:predicted DNA-binding protein with PD1-like motif
VLGYFDRERKEYEEIEVDEQVEVLTLLGDVTVAEGEPKIHAHVVLGKRNAAVGGHLLRAQVWPTLPPFRTRAGGPPTTRSSCSNSDSRQAQPPARSSSSSGFPTGPDRR